ncbi:hypothetical protein VC904_24160 [Citrobacter freundii]|uniref:hypothetical protein n=1 Tax=Citrobacter freundii TaxID=546 RepID=UPI0028BF04B6|nr:hypothetical protein [Citrobacter freundii]MDT7101173.1 hypothetical protein [Citrobacter freundii]MEB0847281.1 hypothetical protein [Citrobacter freundii]
MMSLWDALRMNMMISYQELVRTFPIELPAEIAKDMIESRGYPDIDAKNAWDEWLLYKKTINS